MAMLSVVIWWFTPNVVNKVDNLFVSTYKSYYKRPFKKAKKVLKKDKAKGITALESFLNKVAEVKVSDRSYRMLHRKNGAEDLPVWFCRCRSGRQSPQSRLF